MPAGVVANKRVRFRQRHTNGLTLVELLLATAILALVGLGILSMLGAVTTGTATGTDMHQATIDHTRLAARLGAALREGQQIIACDEHNAIVWTFDLNNDDNPDTHELEWIAWSSAGQTILSLTPDENEADQDLQEDLGLNVAGQTFGALPEALTDALEAGSPTRVVWGNQINALSFDTHETNLQDARLISYRVGLSIGDLTDTVIGTVALRNGAP